QVVHRDPHDVRCDWALRADSVDSWELDLAGLLLSWRNGGNRPGLSDSADRIADSVLPISAHDFGLRWWSNCGAQPYIHMGDPPRLARQIWAVHDGLGYRNLHVHRGNDANAMEGAAHSCAIIEVGAIQL